jgi:hypothetical protein
MFDQQPQKAGLGSLRPAQRRRQLSSGVPVPSAARAVPERCGRLVWRRPGPGSHAPGRSTSATSDQFDEPYQPDDPDEPRNHNEPQESYQPHELHEPYEFVGSGQYTLTASVRL